MKGPNAGTTAAVVIPQAGILLDQAGFLGTTYSDTVAGIVTGKITQSFGLTPATSADLSFESPYMLNLAGQSTNTPKIIIWGNESNPILCRTAGSFGASDDDQGVSSANTAVDIYTTLADIEHGLRFANPALWSFHDWRGDQWAEGRDWLNYDSNTGWRNVIGAAYTTTETYTTSTVICDSHQWQACYASNPPTSDFCVNQCNITQTITETIYHDLPSDGVVTSNSQRNVGGGWWGTVREASNYQPQGVSQREPN